MIITIDGPVASGKSTIAQDVAKTLGFYYLGTGLLYRALAYLLVKKCGYKQEDMYSPCKNDIDNLLKRNRFIYTYDAVNKARVLFDGHDITSELKNSLIARLASILSLNKHVRQSLTALQYRLAQAHDLVVEGRDSGSVVFPRAHYKFFLTASADIRAQRWLHDQRKRGTTFSLSEALERVKQRDKRDKEREISPLRIPDNAVIIDSSDLDRRQTLDQILSVIRNKH